MSKKIRVSDYRQDLTQEIELEDGRLWTVNPPGPGARQEVAEMHRKYFERLQAYRQELETRTEEFSASLDDLTPVARNLKVREFTLLDREPEDLSDDYLLAEKLCLFITPAVTPQDIVAKDGLDPALAHQLWEYVDALMRGDVEAAKNLFARNES